MTTRTGTRIALAALCVALAAACKQSPRQGTAMRLVPVEAVAVGVDAAKLTDSDTTTAASVDAPTRLFLRFARPVALTRVKVHGARSVSVTGSGLGAFGPEDGAGWASAEASGGVAGLTLEVAPTAPGASLGEIEVWGDGERRGDADPAVLAQRSRRGATASAGASASDRVRWVADDVIAFAATPDAATLRPRGTTEGEDCVRLRFESGAAARGARRAYLAYDANLYRAVELTRSVAGGAPSEALWLGTTRDARPVVDELDPRRLSGSDDVLLCLPIEATDPVTLDDVRLVLVEDSGANAFDRDARLALGAAQDGDAATSAALPSGRIELGLDRLVALDRASIRLAAGSGVLQSFGTFDGTAWSEQANVALSDGVTSLDVAARRARALALAFQGASPGVAEVEVAGSGVGPRVGAARIVIAYPPLAWSGGQLVGERFGSDALVAGWAESPAGPGTVEIQGAPVGVDGAFGVALKRPATEGSWTVTLQARFPDGSEATKVIRLDDDRASEIAAPGEGLLSGLDDARFGVEDQTLWETLTPKGGKVKLGTDVTLEAPEGAVSKDTKIGIGRKGPEAMPKLDAGMVNVTAPAHFAYRFLPAGQRFAKPVRLSVPYDPDLLPEGMLPEEIQTYYYDDDERRWLTLPRVAVRRDARAIVSETTHFTFMINAVLVLPDHPGPVSFNPTSIKDLKAADPSSNVDLVEPPQGNGQGTASVTFPIRLPKARGAYQPSFAIAYDSANADGWLGVGWDLHVSSISIDTRYGVPLYDGEERYVLDGAQLVPVAMDAPCSDGKTGRRYMARVERDFRRIVRCGEDTTRFWFEVTDKAGIFYVYGKDPNARLTSYVPHVSAIPRYPPAFDVGQWFLERVVDANENLTELVYQHDDRGGALDGIYSEDFRQVYLADVYYTGHAARTATSVPTRGPYHVHFGHRTANRTDIVTSGRLGFKTMTRKVLASIQVEYRDARVREYALAYETGDFGKSRLRTLKVFGADGTPFYEHAFDYANKEVPDASGAIAAFAPVSGWDEPDGDDKALTSSTDSGFGGHGFVGISVQAPKDSGCVGFALDVNQRTSKTDATFVDMNGDGLPDRMFRAGGAWLARPASGTQPPAMTPLPRPGDPPLPAQGPAFLLKDGQGLGSETSHVFSGAVQLMGYGIDASLGGSYSTTRSSELVLDANGDGLPDLLSDGQVWFNQPGCTGLGDTGACFQRGIPAPVLQPPKNEVTHEPGDPEAGASRSRDETRRDSLAPEDVVLEWTAPFDGLVDVTGELAFSDDVLRSGRRDGVRLRMSYLHPTLPRVLPDLPFRVEVPVPGPYLPIGTDVVKYPADAAPTPIAQRVRVSRGDVLHFVLSTLADFPVGTRADGVTRYSAEQVGFAPVVTYFETGPEGASTFVDESVREATDATGAAVFRYDSAADFRLAGNQQLAVAVPRTGRLKVSTVLQKDPTADDIVACVRYFAPGTYDPERTACDPSDPDGTPYHAVLPSGEASTSSPSLEKDVEAGGILVFWLRSDLAVDPAKVDWRIEGEMTCVRTTGRCEEPTPEERQALRFRATPNQPVHVAADVMWGWQLKTWLPAESTVVPFVPPADGTLYFEVRGGITIPRGVPRPRGSPGADTTQDYLDNPYTFAVRSPDRLHASWKLPVRDARGRPVTRLWDSRAVPVKKGVPVFFEAHGERFYLVDFAIGSVSFQEDGSTDRVPVTGSSRPVAAVTTCAKGLRYRLGNVPLLGGGYHGWRYGVWQGTNDEPFLPYVYRSPPEYEMPRYPDDEEDDADVLKDWYRRVLPPYFKARQSAARTRARTFALLVPSADGTRKGPADPGLAPGVPAWISAGGSAFLTSGHMNAARRGARVNGPNDLQTIAAYADFGAASRSSVSTTVTGGVQLPVASISLSAGMSHQEEDLVDLNGDRIPDALQSSGVPDLADLATGDLAGFLAGGGSASARITDPATMAPRGELSVPVQPRLNVDVGGQVGLGITEAVKLLAAKNQVRSVSGRLPNLSFTGGVGVGMNVSTTVADLVDVNGDGLPDAVRKNDRCGGFSVRLNLGNGFAHGEDCLPRPGSALSDLSGLAGVLDPSSALSNSDAGSDFDKTSGMAGSMIGQARSPSALRQTSTVTLQGSLGGSAVDGTESYGASVSSESSLSSTNVMFVDVTGDGLPDWVTKSNTSSQFLVAVNRGYGFAAPEPWNAPPWPAGWKPNFQTGSGSFATLEGLVSGFWSRASDGIDPVEATGTHTNLPSTSFVFTVAFPLTPVLTPWLQLSFGANATLGRETGFELGMQDIDGDGLPDHVVKKRGSGSIRARVNQLGGANLLKHVTRPLGGSFDVEYERVGNTVEMPESRWTLARVTVHDGVGSGVGHDLATSYRYGDGFYHRNEREFLGFRTVTRSNADGSKVVQTFLNEDFRHKGLLQNEIVLDESGRKLVETYNRWELDPAGGAALKPCLDRTPIALQYPDRPLYCEASFPKLAWTEKRLYEGLDAAAMRSRQEFRYDGLGNVVWFHDHGDVADPADDVFAFLEHRAETATGAWCPAAVTGMLATAVDDANAPPLRKRKGEYDDRCNLTKLRSYVAGTEAVTDLEWYDRSDPAAGALKKVTSPPNHLGDRYHVEFAYDPDVHTYVTWTRDVHGYVSEAGFSPKFGENLWTKDVNGQITSRALDEFGRLLRVAAPGFTIVHPTIAITYGEGASVPWAVTKNRAPDARTLETVVLMDGIGRVIQTKKTAEVWSESGETTKVGWAVTGRQRFDAMGRVAEQGQTFYDGGPATAFLPGAPLNPTRLAFDALGRTVTTTEPNDATTRFTYGFGTPAGSALVQHKITSIDPLGKVRVAYQDPTDRTNAVEEHVDGRTPTTRYGYDPMGQLVTVTDAAGNVTRVAYDELGRRTTIESLDAGTTMFAFDLAGNVTTRQDAKGIATTYVYDFERLKEVRYPTVRRNVTYEYGPPGAPENAAARVTRVDDEVGNETRGYDALGNLVRSTRTIDPIRPGDRTRTFTTTFDFDVFGRMLSMVYPDGEVLKYGYDAGGLLRSAVGIRAATKHDPAQQETYLATLLYDEFGQRRYQRVGNGVVTKYAYEPLTRRLSWLHAQKPGERLLQNLTYGYDLVGNVLGVKNTLGEATPPNAGTVEVEYRYDDLHRLVWANGSAKSRPRTIDTFTSTFAYSDIHDITSNVQVHRIVHGGGPGEFPPHTNHDLAYEYRGAGPHRATRIGDTWLVYDKNGNTSTECRDPADSTCTQRPSHLRRYEWTEENRLDVVIDGGGKNATKFLYDADGQRIAKLGRGGESITVGQFWSLKGRRAATKHVFAGTTRIASKLLPPPGWDDVPRGSEPTAVVTVSDTDNGCVPSSYQPQKCQVLPGGEPVLNDYYADAKVRPETYYYHPDHLGSTSWVTDQNAKPHEHVEYFPYGSVWRDPRSDLGASPQKGQRFLFTSKELDEETGLYYFGARYYDPRLGRWLSPDPLLGSYLAGAPNRGVFQPLNLALYSYAANNPIAILDLDGLVNWSKFGEAFVKNVGPAIIGGLVVGAMIASGGTLAIVGAAIAVAGSGAAGFELGQLATNTDAFTGRTMSEDEWSDRSGALAGQLTGGLIGGARGMRGGPQARGRASEARVLEDIGVPKNTQTVSGTDGNSIPDGITPREVIDVKDTAKLSRDPQMRIQQEYAAATGRQHTVYTGVRTQVSRPLQRTSNIVRRPDLGPMAVPMPSHAPGALMVPWRLTEDAEKQ